MLYGKFWMFWQRSNCENILSNPWFQRRNVYLFGGVPGRLAEESGVLPGRFISGKMQEIASAFGVSSVETQSEF
jgi:hypothetical protein